MNQVLDNIRQPGVAGFFYPDDPQELRQMIDGLLEQAKGGTSPPKALIAPHAGYIYSGPTAAEAYATLKPLKSAIRRVILMGPAHRVYFRGLALPAATRFATPLGTVEIDQELYRKVLDFPQVSVIDKAFDQEHSLEVHLPFLQTTLETFFLLPFVVGETPAVQIAEVLETVWGGDDTLIVISSDLSHFHDYRLAKEIDKETGFYISNLQIDRLDPERACGCMPVRGLLRLAKQKDMSVDILNICNSGDTAGGRDRVVGYGAFAFYRPDTLDPEQREQLLEIARRSIAHGFENRCPLIPDISAYPPAMTAKRPAFVTLKINGSLRGCTGTTATDSPLVINVAESACNAAFQDPRFPALTREEFDRLDIGISVLTPKTPVHFSTQESLLEQLEPGKDGLVISKGSRQAVFLPSVWDGLAKPGDFLHHLKRKAGMEVHELPDQAWRFRTESF